MPLPEYSQLVLDHFHRPRNVGTLHPADDVLTASAGSHDRGVLFQVSARVQKNAIAEVRFETYGCPHCIAAASWLSERLRGAAVDDLERWSWREAVEALDVPPEKRGRFLILEDAIRALAATWRARS